jgi:hypothetical protein
MRWPGYGLVPLVHRADAGLGHPDARGVVPGTEDECFEAICGSRYGFYVGEAEGGLYLRFELYLARLQAWRSPLRPKQGVKGMQVFGAFDFGDQDQA